MPPSLIVYSCIYKEHAMAQDLLDFIDFSNLECLNEQPSHPGTCALKQGEQHPYQGALLAVFPLIRTR